MTPAPDQEDRDRIRHDIATNLFVEAGAGAGKTTSLVSRIVELVRFGVGIGSIAAITFTEKAAADLRHRLRQELRHESERTAGSLQQALFEGALDDLDHAPIGTLHAFARRLLTEFPVAAGLPPGFTVLDELESNLAFEERWEDLLERLLDDPHPAGGSVEGGVDLVEICEFDKFGLASTFRRVATGFHENWDLVDARVDCSEPPSFTVDVARLIALVEAACEIETPPADTQSKRLAELARHARRLRSATTLDRLAAANELETGFAKADKFGSKANWKAFGGDAMLAELRSRELAVADEARRVVTAARQHRVRLVGAILGRWVLESARVPRRRGNARVPRPARARPQARLHPA